VEQLYKVTIAGLTALALASALGLASCGKSSGKDEVKADAPAYTPQQAAALRAAADKGDAAAQLKVGRMYATGDGASQDTTEAVTWYRKAANQGLAEAQFTLGDVLQTGTGVEGSTDLAAKEFEKAAAQGHVEAMKRLGKILENRHDFAGAGTYYEKAAEKGDPHAQYHLGTMYDLGFTFEPSDLVAVGLGEKRTEFLPNKSRAVYWYRKAAEQGWCDRTDTLSLYYRTGEGVKKDPVEGYKWALVAASAPPPDYVSEKTAQMQKGVVETLVTDAKNVLTAAQEAEGERLAREQIARVKCVVTTASYL
jgi:TPR repeat protein